MSFIKRFDLSAAFTLPSAKELIACWDLTRLDDGPGVVLLCPLGKHGQLLSVSYTHRVLWIVGANPGLSVIHVAERLLTFLVLCGGVKAFIMTVDDIIDADIDAKVSRTKNRAIPRGDITMTRAWLFLALQAAIGMYLANKCLKPYTVYIAAPAWPLFVVYPTCKRWMSFAPIILGLMFNPGVFIGWSDLSPDGRIPWELLSPVYIGCCFWVITYETVYQHLDREEDVKLGVRSLAIFCGEHTNLVCGISSVLFTGLLAYGAYINGHGPVLYMAIVIVARQLLFGIANTDINVKSQCMDFFLLIPRTGMILVAGFIADVLMHRWMNGLPF